MRIAMVVEIIAKYLETNKRLVVPNLGAFIVKVAGEQILFSNLIKGDDGVLRGLLMQSGSTEMEAAAIIDRFVFEVNFRLQERGECALRNFGRLRSGVNGTVSFEYAPAEEDDVLESVTKSGVVDESVSEPANEEQEPVPAEQETLQDRREKAKSKKLFELGKSRYDDREEVLRSTSIRRDKSIRGLTYRGDGGPRQATGYKSRQTKGIGGWLLVLVVAAAMLAVGVLLYGEIFGNHAAEETATPAYEAMSKPEPTVENPDMEYIQQPE